MSPGNITAYRRGYFEVENRDPDLFVVDNSSVMLETVRSGQVSAHYTLPVKKRRLLIQIKELQARQSESVTKLYRDV